jgi:hypothetical protein
MVYTPVSPRGSVRLVCHTLVNKYFIRWSYFCRFSRCPVNKEAVNADVHNTNYYCPVNNLLVVRSCRRYSLLYGHISCELPLLNVLLIVGVHE